MGLLAKLKNLGEEVGKGALHVGEAALLGYQRRVQDPNAYLIAQVFDRDPESWRDVRTQLANYYRAVAQGERGPIEEELKARPTGVRLLSQGLGDPLNYLGVGAALSATGKATKTGFTAAGARGALQSGTREAVKEIVGLSGIGVVGDVAHLGVSATRLPYQLLRGNRVEELRNVDAALEIAHIGAADALSVVDTNERNFLLRQQDRIRMAVGEELGRFRPDIGRIRELTGQYDELANAIRGDDIAAADTITNLSPNRVKNVVAAFTDPVREHNFAAKRVVGQANAAERTANAIPPLRWAQNFISPVTRAKFEDHVRLAEVGKKDAVSYLTEVGQHAGVHVGLAQRRAGLIPDLASGNYLDKAGRVVGNMDDVRRTPSKFKLTKEQRDVIDAFNYGLRNIATKLREVLADQPELLKDPDVKAFIAELTQPDKRGGFFSPRVAKFVAEGELTASDFGQALASEGGISKLLRRYGVKQGPPPGFKAAPPAARRLGGAKQTVEFARQNEAATDAERVIFSGDLGGMLASYAEQAGNIISWDGVFVPTLREASKQSGLALTGKTAAQFFGQDLQQAAVQAGRARVTHQRASALANTIASGRNATGKHLDQIKRLRASPNMTPEGRAALEPLERAVADFLDSGPFRASKGAERAQLQKVEKAERAALRGERNTELETATRFTPKQGKELGEAARQAGKSAREGFTFSAESREQERIAREALARAARDAQPALKEAAAITAQQAKDINETKRNIMASKTMFGAYRRLRNVPGFNNRVFEDRLATEIEKALGTEQTSGAAAGLSVLAIANGAVQALQAGGDLSYAFIQNMAALAVNPTGWGKALLYSLGSASPVGGDSIYYRYIDNLANTIDAASGKSWLQLAQESGLSMQGTELYQPSEALTALGVSKTPMKRALKFIDNLPLNRAWGYGRNMAAVEMFKSQVTLEQALKLNQALTAEELQAIGRQVNLATGVVDYQKLGIRPTQAAAERLLGRFGAQWFRSQTGRLVQAMNAGMDGRVARRLLAQQLGAMTVAYIGVAALTNQTAELNPINDDGSFNTRFLTLKFGNNRVGFSTPYRSMMRFISDTGQMVAGGEWERIASFRDNRNKSNPLFGFWRSGAPTLAGLLSDLVLEATGNAEFETTIDNPQDLVTPFSAQEAVAGLVEGDVKGAGQSYMLGTFGFNVNRRYAPELWREETQNAARAAGYDEWDDIPKAQQEEMIRTNADLRNASAARDAYFANKPQDKTDWAYQEVENSQKAGQVALAGAWARVEAGEITKAEFRQMVSDYNARNAIIADTVLGNVPKSQRKQETVQDTLAAAYQSIRPEQFLPGSDDPNQPPPSLDTATREERDAAFAEWRAAKRAFWTQHPEAEQFRHYIEVEYPTRHTTDDALRAALMERKDAEAAYDAFLQIPKYKGLSAEDGSFLDAVIGLGSRARQTIQAELASRGSLNVEVPRQVAWQYALAQLRDATERGDLHLTPRQTQLIQLAMALDQNPRGRQSLVSTERLSYLRDRPQLAEWYPAAYQDTGIDDDILSLLGVMPQALGGGVVPAVQSAQAEAFATGAGPSAVLQSPETVNANLAGPVPAGAP